VNSSDKVVTPSPWFHRSCVSSHIL
jgi:hypothetical protein